MKAIKLVSKYIKPEHLMRQLIALKLLIHETLFADVTFYAAVNYDDEKKKILLSVLQFDEE